MAYPPAPYPVQLSSYAFDLRYLVLESAIILCICYAISGNYIRYAATGDSYSQKTRPLPAIVWCYIGTELAFGPIGTTLVCYRYFVGTKLAQWPTSSSLVRRQQAAVRGADPPFTEPVLPFMDAILPFMEAILCHIRKQCRHSRRKSCYLWL
eukprot:2290758-Rhodomonas_salina.1